ncbi:MAG: aspartate aminotransferase family protein [Candidatus Firestonebacteria bacterium]|nr:aspartate aminotransferase family protein [Candidatus Firestonebacteria bacterium]
MAKEYALEVKKIEKVTTPYRKMVTDTFPVRKSIEVIKRLRKYEPRSMSGQPLALWDHASGFNVFDKYGNKWLDWSSGVLVANIGHSNPEIKKAMIKQINHGLLHNYCFPSEARANLTEKLSKMLPKPLKKIFLLTTGSEAVEVCLKLARTYGQKIADKKKIAIISFNAAFHGRTMGSQMAGGSPALKEWIVNLDKDMHNVPFPNCYRCPLGKPNYQGCDTECFNKFVKNITKKLGGKPADRAAGIIMESFQGGGATFAPKGFMKLLRKFCTANKILLICDEVQAGFGRSGKMFSFQHYNIVPDLTTFGKGITSSMPLSAVAGRPDVMDIYEPNTMTSTHTGNPVCVASAMANLDYLVKHKVVQNAAKVGAILKAELHKIKEKHTDIIGEVQGEGLVYGMHIVKEGSRNPDGDLAHLISAKCVEKGLMVFSPVGLNGGTLKIAPPLIITAAAILDGVKALEEAITEAKREMLGEGDNL